MTEKINIQGNDVWIKVESHIAEEEEYFTATYYSVNPETSQGGVLLIDRLGKPFIFKSPVEALEYCTEKLIGVDGLPESI